MENNKKTTFKELMLKMISSKTFWRLSIALILLIGIVVGVIVDARTRVNDTVDEEAAITETVEDTPATTDRIDIPATDTVTPAPTDMITKIEDTVVEEDHEENITDISTEVKQEETIDDFGTGDIVEDEPEDVVEDIVIENEEDTPVEEDDRDIIYDIYEPNPDDVEMLACVIYQEAGGDAACDDCRRRVADVVLNRVADSRFPDTIYGVLTAEAQYGRFHWTGIVWPERASNPGEAHAVERAYRIAREVLSGQHSDLYGNGYVFQAEFIQSSDYIYCCGHYFCR